MNYMPEKNWFYFSEGKFYPISELKSGDFNCESFLIGGKVGQDFTMSKLKACQPL